MNYLMLGMFLLLTGYTYIFLANKFNVIDNPNHRSSHVTPTIRGGGILFIVSLMIYAVTHMSLYPFMYLAVGIIAFISFTDDLLSLTPKVRFLIQIVTILIISYQTGFLFTYWLPILLLFGVGMVNQYNFMDGINGITGMYSMVILGIFYLINQQENVIDTDLFYYMAIAIAVFGYFNFRKRALFFAGDIGSVSISVFLMFIALTLMYQLDTLMPAILFLVYFVDTFSTIVFRLSIKEKVWEAHRHHIYQKVVDHTKLTHLQTAFIYAFLQFLIGLIVYKTYALPIILQLILIFSIFFVLVLLYILLFKYFKKFSIA